MLIQLPGALDDGDYINPKHITTVSWAKDSSKPARALSAVTLLGTALRYSTLSPADLIKGINLAARLASGRDDV